MSASAPYGERPYPLNGKIIFSILSIRDYVRNANLPSAVADARVMREAFKHLGMTEYDKTVGDMRSMTKSYARKHVISMSQSPEIEESCMAIIVISGHGSFQGDGQHVWFSDDKTIRLFELIKPLQMKLKHKPLLIFGDLCRGDHNKDLHGDLDDLKYKDAAAKFKQSSQTEPMHIMADTFIFYASVEGNVAYAGQDKDEPSKFLGVLSKELIKYGKSEDMDAIKRRVSTKMTELYSQNNSLPPLLPCIEASHCNKRIRFYDPDQEPEIKAMSNHMNRLQLDINCSICGESRHNRQSCDQLNNYEISHSRANNFGNFYPQNLRPEYFYERPGLATLDRRAPRCDICGEEGHNQQSCDQLNNYKIFHSRANNFENFCQRPNNLRPEYCYDRTSTLDRRAPRCGICGEEGHNRRTCDRSPAMSNGRRAPRCSRCGEQGHNIRTCR